MSERFMMNKKSLFIIILGVFTLPHCYKESSKKTLLQEYRTKLKKKIIQEHKGPITFLVNNQTDHPMYACCFYYARRATGNRWMWYKTAIADIKQGEEKPIYVPLDSTFADHNSIQGELAIFKTKDDAQTSILELLNDEQKFDLGKIYKLNDKVITIAALRYGIKGEELEHEPISIEDAHKKNQTPQTEVLPALNFYVENRTGKDLLMTSFVYEMVGAHHQWDFEKLPLRRVNNGETTFFDVETVARKYEWENVRAYLGVFNLDEKQEALDCTYETLQPSHKLGLGPLRKLYHKKIVIEPKIYGILGGFDERHPEIEFSLRPMKRNDVLMEHYKKMKK